MKTKKELTEEYKQLKFKMGLFQIRNVINGKIFVESSINLYAIGTGIERNWVLGATPVQVFKKTGRSLVRTILNLKFFLKLNTGKELLWIIRRI